MKNHSGPIKFLRRFRAVYTPALHILFIFLWPLSRIHKLLAAGSRNKRVLLITQNSVAADHMRYINDLLAANCDISQYATTDWVPPRELGKHEIQRAIDATYINVLHAFVQHWDLIVFTNHSFGVGIWFPPWISKLYVNHGLHIGKINNDKGEDGVYGRSRIIRPFNTPFYNRMFASSEKEKDFALDLIPELEGRIRVTGFLRADIFVTNEQTLRTQGRAVYGWSSKDNVVHVISTWGSESLIGRHGDSILREVRRLSKQYKFILSLHPRFDEFNTTSKLSREDIFLAWEQSGCQANRSLDWEQVIAASDVAISDHSSLSLYHVLINHPIIFVDVPKQQYLDDSTFALLQDRYPTLTEPSMLESLLSDIRVAGNSKDISKVQDHILSHKGSARKRYMAEIDELLYGESRKL